MADCNVLKAQLRVQGYVVLRFEFYRPSNLIDSRSKEMADGTKLFYVVVVDDEKKNGGEKMSFRYTRHVLQSTLQLMGCKARHAFKISRRVFELMQTEYSGDASVTAGVVLPGPDDSKGHPQKRSDCDTDGCSVKENSGNHLIQENDDRSKSKPSESYKKRSTVIVKRETFLKVVSDALAEYKYVGPNQRADLVLACRLRERKESVTVLLCGTSGCGKSTLSALLGSRLGITTVVSTDSIRHMMRSFVHEKQNPLLWASTYHAGEYLDPVAVAQAKAKRKAKKLAVVSSHSKDDAADGLTSGRSPPKNTVGLISPRQMAIEGFKAQSEMVIDSLDRLITSWEERKESVVVEGVHLSLNFVMGLMKKHPSIIPFMIYITNEEKHVERFAVRAKYMTLDPDKNKYVKYIRNIRTIQEYLCNRADKHLVPKINNTNVDKSVAAIHATLFGCLRRRQAGEPLYESTTNTVTVINEEYRNQCIADSLTSKGMFQLIQRQGSSRHLMALLNTDGSVARAWPVDSDDCYGKEPMYGPLRIGKAEPVNLQFGHFGMSAWQTDTGCTSYASSVDGTENGSRYYSSCCSSPRMSDGPSKELKEEQSVDGSEEEVDDPPEGDSDEDLSDHRKHIHEDQGSVDEESTKSDEEYDDLAMEDGQDDGYLSEYEEISNTNKTFSKDQSPRGVSSSHKKYGHNFNLFLKAKSASMSVLPRSNSNITNKNEKISSPPPINRIRRRSQSIPSSKDASYLNGLSLSLAAQS